MGLPEIWARAAALLTAIDNRQNTYFANKGRYFAGLLTHSAFPADDADTAPDLLTSHPIFQAESWADLFSNLPATLPAALEVQSFVNPDGSQGYAVFAWVVQNGRIWRRCFAQGPKGSLLAHGWKQIDLTGG